jgi:hypothetical protein
MSQTKDEALAIPRDIKDLHLLFIAVLRDNNIQNLYQPIVVIHPRIMACHQPNLEAIKTPRQRCEARNLQLKSKRQYSVYVSYEKSSTSASDMLQEGRYHNRSDRSDRGRGE